MKKIVLAPTYAHFLDWCREQGVSPLWCNYVSHTEQIMGLELSPDDIVDLGGGDVDRDVLATRIRRPSTSKESK